MTQSRLDIVVYASTQNTQSEQIVAILAKEFSVELLAFGSDNLPESLVSIAPKALLVLLDDEHRASMLTACRDVKNNDETALIELIVLDRANSIQEKWKSTMRERVIWWFILVMTLSCSKNSV